MPAMFLPDLTGTSETEYGDGCGTNARKRQRTRYWPPVGPVIFGARARSGKTDLQSSSCSQGPRSADTASPGWGHLTLPCLLESRMRNESRTSGSGRGGKKPIAERRYGAYRLLLHIRIEPPKGRNVKTGRNQDKPAHIRSRRDFYDWLATPIHIDGIESVERDAGFDNRTI